MIQTYKNPLQSLTQPISVFEFGRDFPNFLIDKYMSKNQLIRLFAQTKYSDVTHELYYHIGKFFKKRYLAARSNMNALRRSILPSVKFRDTQGIGQQFEIGGTVIDKDGESREFDFFSNVSPENLATLRDAYEKMLSAKNDWQQIFRWIRGTSEDADYFRQGVATFAKNLIQGNYMYSELLPTEYQSLEDIFADWRNNE